jgi:hypothetical protein
MYRLQDVFYFIVIYYIISHLFISLYNSALWTVAYDDCEVASQGCIPF